MSFAAEKKRSGLCCYLWCYWLIMIVQVIEQGQVVILTGSIINSFGFCSKKPTCTFLYLRNTIETMSETRFRILTRATGFPGIKMMMICYSLPLFQSLLLRPF